MSIERPKFNILIEHRDAAVVVVVVVVVLVLVVVVVAVAVVVVVVAVVVAVAIAAVVQFPVLYGTPLLSTKAVDDETHEKL